MAKKDLASNRPSRKQSRRGAAPTQTPASLFEPEYLSDPLSQSQLIRTIETERAHLLQAHSLIKCLYETLLYADGKDAVLHADVANVAAKLIDESVARLDFVRLAPMIQALPRLAPPTPTQASDEARSAEAASSTQPAAGHKVEEGRFPYKVEDKPRYLC